MKKTFEQHDERIAAAVATGEKDIIDDALRELAEDIEVDAVANGRFPKYEDGNDPAYIDALADLLHTTADEIKESAPRLSKTLSLFSDSERFYAHILGGSAEFRTAFGETFHEALAAIYGISPSEEE